ncbi:hypothetical protein KY495_23290 [Massilia sp. PAMC28688]|uniref:hypothetical protein n=1 Tax=Massilia sp. PAMC28688 TaxID=2861283 RepID=UPI001C634E8B|nr:hypothetical protein [Massilia sp. PAMC28688]QYF93545.1 hypothetical protein KY495_23290 [Massilia sp. PAMC28688]
MSLQQRTSLHLASRVERKTAMVTFLTSIGVLLGALLTGACVLVVLVFFYGFGTDAFATRLSADAILRLKYLGAVLGAVGGASFLVFILGSCMLAAALNGGRYRNTYLWFGAISALLALGIFLRVQSY